MKLELYFTPGTCAFVPHFGLEVIKATTGQSFEPKLLKLHKGEQSTPEYKALNPDGQVPLLIVDGKPLAQVVAMCDFLDRSFPQAKLLPSDSVARAHALATFAWFNNTVHATFTHFFLPSRFTPDETAQATIKAKATADYRAYIDRMQAMIAATGTPFFGGSAPNFLDAYALTLYRWGGMSGIDPATTPALRDYIDRLATNAHIAAVLERERIPVHTFKAA